MGRKGCALFALAFTYGSHHFAHTFRPDFVLQMVCQKWFQLSPPIFWFISDSLGGVIGNWVILILVILVKGMY